MQTSNFVNQVICGDSAQELKKLPDNLIDLTVTSPPYDNLRDYEGYSFDFQTIAKELFRITKSGGVLVWVVGDATIDGSETLTSFKQVLYFKEIGFTVHDTMIYYKCGPPRQSNRYEQNFEYMFVLSKGKPKTFNPIKEKSKTKGKIKLRKCRDNNGDELKISRNITAPTKLIGNVWGYSLGGITTTDRFIFEHPATFPEELASDHIKSWSNEGDLILDPFAGSGTTLKMAKLNRRNYLGIEISQKYIEIINKRLEKHNNQSIEVFCS